ncbi:MAG: acyltransferase [Enterovibrio sp.]
MTIHAVKQWLKSSRHPAAVRLYKIIKAIRCASLPLPKWLARALYLSFNALAAFWHFSSRTLFWTPLFKGAVRLCGKNLYLYGGMPLITGPLVIEIGDNCRICGQSTFSARTASAAVPELLIGNNVDIGWQTTIACATRVVLNDNVKIAGRAFLAGYPGHPLSSSLRAANFPELDQQVGEIILQEDVWLATGVTVLAGVTIGRGTVVAAGSVVTKDLPPFVLAAGIPAKKVRDLTDEERQ